MKEQYLRFCAIEMLSCPVCQMMTMMKAKLRMIVRSYSQMTIALLIPRAILYTMLNSMAWIRWHLPNCFMTNRAIYNLQLVRVRIWFILNSWSYKRKRRKMTFLRNSKRPTSWISVILAWKIFRRNQIVLTSCQIPSLKSKILNLLIMREEWIASCVWCLRL